MAKIPFSLFAPYNERASLVCEFYDGKDIPMQKGDDGVFRVEVDLADGSYAYRFRVQSKSWFLEPDAWVTVVDPKATAVLDTADPAGIVHVSGGKRVLDTYEWKHDDVPLPHDHGLVIYELHVADFSGGESDPFARGRFEHVVEKLDYLEDLGVNAIQLMPIEEFPGEQSWGYNPRYLFAPESSYGTSESLKALVDACHARGIRVFKDGVYNHSEASAPLTQIDHDYWYRHSPKDPDNNWGPEFDYEKYDEWRKIFPARTFIADVLTHWVSEYHLDGLRFDAARQIGQFEFLSELVAHAKRVAGPKPFYTIAEHIPDTPAVTGYEGPMDACWHESFHYAMCEVMLGQVSAASWERLKDHLDARRRGYEDSANVVNYLSTHDHGHIMHLLGEAGVFGSEAIKRIELGAALLMTALGTPLVWMGDEFGEYKYKTQEQAKLDWTLLANDENRALHAYFRGLIRLRTNNSALFGNDIAFFHENPDAGILAYVRWNAEGSRVVVVANVSGIEHGDYRVPEFPADGTWHEWTRDFDVEARNGEVVLDLPAYEARVLVL